MSRGENPMLAAELNEWMRETGCHAEIGVFAGLFLVTVVEPSARMHVGIGFEATLTDAFAEAINSYANWLMKVKGQ